MKTSQRQKLPKYGTPLLSITHEKLALITLGSLLNAISRSEFDEGLAPAVTAVSFEIGQRCRFERIYSNLVTAVAGRIFLYGEPLSFRTFLPVLDLKPAPETSRRNYTWAQLMKRVFLPDVLQCEHCGGRMKIIAAIGQPTVVGKILRCLGLPSRAPPLTPVIST